jgi:hypothetical protein
MSGPRDEIGTRNRLAGWLLFLAGIIGGMLLGLWAFDGPLHAPARFADYAGLPRRLLRLAHIAAMALGLTNIFFGHELPHLALTARAKSFASSAMIAAGVLMPAVLTVASFDERFKYLLPLPSTAALLAVGMVCMGLARAQGTRRSA